MSITWANIVRNGIKLRQDEKQIEIKGPTALKKCGSGNKKKMVQNAPTAREIVLKRFFLKFVSYVEWVRYHKSIFMDVVVSDSGRSYVPRTHPMRAQDQRKIGGGCYNRYMAEAVNFTISCDGCHPFGDYNVLNSKKQFILKLDNEAQTLERKLNDLNRTIENCSRETLEFNKYGNMEALLKKKEAINSRLVYINDIFRRNGGYYEYSYCLGGIDVDEACTAAKYYKGIFNPASHYQRSIDDNFPLCNPPPKCEDIFPDYPYITYDKEWLNDKHRKLYGHLCEDENSIGCGYSCCGEVAAVYHYSRRCPHQYAHTIQRFFKVFIGFKNRKLLVKQILEEFMGKKYNKSIDFCWNIIKNFLGRPKLISY